MKVSLITPSYNKPEYVIDTVKSIVNQTYKNWEYTIIENSTDEVTRDKIKQYISNLPQEIKNKIIYIEKNFSIEERRTKYIPSIIVNDFYKNTKNTDLLFYISDDDYLHVNCFDYLVKEFNNNNNIVFYFKLGLLQQRGSSFINVGELPAMNTFGKEFNKTRTPVDYVDGGQIIFKKELLNKISYPFFEENLIQGVSNHCDGLFLEKIANTVGIPPISFNIPLGFHRITTKSTWRKA